jgi:hypothetical protein
MPLVSKRLSVLASILFVLMLSTSALADTIRLKDGSIIKGRIVSFVAGRFTIAIGEGSRIRQLTYSAAEIESITFDQPAVGSVASRDADYKRPVELSRVVVTDATRGAAQKPAEIRPNPGSQPARPELKKAEPRTSPAAPATAPVVQRPAAPTANTTTKPISWNVKVLADNTSNGWTNTGWVVKKGQTIRISASGGTISLGGGRTTEATGSPDIVDNNKLLKAMPTGGLIAVIGDDNNDFIYVGASREITAQRDGALFLGINEGNLDDNSGSFDVKIEIVP